MNHIERGKAGEALAADLLRKKQHQIIATNFRFRRGEIDIISISNNKLIATEVKTRETAQFGSPHAAVSRSKQRQIISVMNAFIDQSQRSEEVQFDVISIVLSKSKTEIEHIENAFYPLI
ncbi:MAG: YraN family protein [Flavobacteriales bacterium]|nr:YraN family protein [Flavobacteriales bacterium]